MSEFENQSETLMIRHDDITHLDIVSGTSKKSFNNAGKIDGDRDFLLDKQ
jgi:hypothetical protein